MPDTHHVNAGGRLESLLAQRILVLDGAMGTMVQTLQLDEADVRGRRFAEHPKPLKNFIDLLCLTRPEIIRTSTASTWRPARTSSKRTPSAPARVAMEDFELEHLVRELNLAAAAVPGRRPTSSRPGRRTGRGSSPARSARPARPRRSRRDVEDPGYRAVTFDQLVDSYYEQVAALVEGGVDILFPETTFDTLNLKACLFAIDKFFDEHRRPPARDGLGDDHRRQRPHAVRPDDRGVLEFDLALPDCSAWGSTVRLGPERMRPYVEELSQIAPVYTSCHPNAGLPNEFGGYDETPEQMAGVLRRVRGQRLAEHRGRLLRHDAGAHPRVRRDGPRPAAAPPAGRRAAHAAQRPGSR